MAPLVLITGTGTGIGKTYVAKLVVRAWAERLRVAGSRAHVIGLKPIESGGTEDGVGLGQASTFHVTRLTPPYLLADPVSPHLAARREGRTIDLARLEAWVEDARRDDAVDGVVVELAGGLFSPLSDTTTNADLARLLGPAPTLLVAPDRLGVLHDVLATTRAARAEGVAVTAVVLSEPSTSDTSTGTNAAELTRLLRDTPATTLRRGAVVEDVRDVVDVLLDAALRLRG